MQFLVTGRQICIGTQKQIQKNMVHFQCSHLFNAVYFIHIIAATLIKPGIEPHIVSTFTISVKPDLEPFSVVNIARYLLAFGIFVPDENDGLIFLRKKNRVSNMYSNNNSNIKIHG